MMKILEPVNVILYALKKLGLMGVDAIGDIVGGSLSFSTEKFLQPQQLSDFINHYGVEPLSGPVNITAVSSLNIESISSNCNNTIIRLKEEGSSGLPGTLFVKLPSSSVVTRLFLNVIGSWELETHFCKNVAARLPIRTPKTYAAHSQGSRFALVQENLHADPSVQLFTNLDMLEGPSIEVAKRCLDTFAKLHASHHGLSEPERDVILPMSGHLFLRQPMKTVSKTLDKLGLAPCLKKQPGVIPEHLITAYKKSLKHWGTLLEAWFSGPLMLIHGDSHLGNFFVCGDEMGMLYFQAVHWGKGIRDVQYFLIDSLPSDVLAEHEQSLIQFYIECLAAYGVTLSVEDAWQQYRSFTFHTLMTMVVSIGFAAMSEEQDALMAEILKRAVAACERADYSQWLDDTLSTA